MATPLPSPTVQHPNLQHPICQRLPGGHRLHRESGYILIGVLILVALFFIVLAVAAPIMAKSIERDKEVETVRRGKQYTRAIKLYYKRFGNYPPTLAALENTNNIRYLRKRYIDPISGKDDWRIIHIGQAKVPVYGFFGQPLQPGQGSATTGALGNGTGGVPGSGNTGSFGNSASSAFGGSSSFGGSSFGSSSSGTGSTFGSSTSGDPTSTAGGGAGAPAGVIPGGSAPGAGQSGFGSPANGTSGTGATGTNGTAGTGNNTFDGGGPIVGVGIPLEKKSLVIYHKQDAFNKWEFTYDPIQDQMTISNSTGAAGTTPAGTPIGGTPGSNGTTSNSPFGNSGSGTGSTGIGSSGNGSGSGSTVGSPTGTPSPGSDTPQNQ